MEKKITDEEIIANFAKSILESSKELPTEFSKIIDEEFWNLI